MELTVVTASTQKKNIRIDKPVSQILVTVDAGWDTFTNETITLKIESKNGSNIDNYKKIFLRHAALMKQQGAGAIITKAGKTRIAIPLSEFGVLAITNDETIVLDLEGLKSARTYEVDGFEFGKMTRVSLQVETKKVVAGVTETNLNLEEYSYLVVDKLNTVDSIEFMFEREGNEASRTQKGNPRELEHLAAELNDAVVTSDALTEGAPNLVQTVYGHDNALVLPIDKIERMTMYSDGTENDITLIKRIKF